MKHIAGWFRRNNTIMAQAKDLSRQLQEAWDERDELDGFCGEALLGYRRNLDRADSLQEQLHRVARERDQEREKRLAAEDARIDYHLDKPSEEEIATIENYKLDNILAELDNEEE